MRAAWGRSERAPPPPGLGISAPEALCSLSRPPCRCPVSADFELWGGRDRAGDGAWAWHRADLMPRARARPAAAVRAC